MSTKLRVIAQNWATGKSYRTPFDSTGNLLMVHVNEGSYPSKIEKTKKNINFIN